jgi:DNA-binding transcriptional MerR regulator
MDISRKRLLDETGYSYSGISDIVHNKPEHTQELLQEINAEYLSTKAKISELEQQLVSLKNNKAVVVSCFIHAHQSLKLGDKPLCFLDADTTVVVQRVGDNTIDYESYKHTPMS